jgi:phosphoenolpyruvate synthase/pyruvate phosphate dikinase
LTWELDREFGRVVAGFDELAEWLVQQGIESMSLNPDTGINTRLHLAKTVGMT